MLDNTTSSFKAFENAYTNEGVRSAHAKVFSEFSKGLEKLDDRFESILEDSFLDVNNPSDCFYLLLRCAIETQQECVEITYMLYASESFPQALDTANLQITKLKTNPKSESTKGQPKLFWSIGIFGELTTENDLLLFELGSFGSTIASSDNTIEFSQQAQSFVFDDMKHGLGELIELSDDEIISLFEANALL